MVSAERVLHRPQHSQQLYSNDMNQEMDEETSSHATNEVEIGETNKVQKDDALKELANRRQNLLEEHRAYKKLNKKWVSIEQTWDEQNPCR